jgi:hypothetical protein
MTDTAFHPLQRFVLALKERGLVAAPAGKPLLVYGYVRSPGPEPTYANSCAQVLDWWATAAGWELGAVFRDVGVCSSQLTRPGFTGLLDALLLPDAAMAIVVEKRQLSRKPDGLKRLRATIHQTGSGLRILADELESPS